MNRYLLAGGSGQIGSLLKVYLSSKGVFDSITRSSTSLPKSKHIVNAAGYTKFDNNIERYWQDNIELTVRLATHAAETGAYFHLLSSEAVAEYRSDLLPEEVDSAQPHPKMIPYALSKTLMEKIALSIVPRDKLYIYRICDVVPPVPLFKMKHYWRRNHWLSILYSAGKRAFSARDSFPVWVAPVDYMAQAISLLIDYSPPGAYHLLGRQYTWSLFHSTAHNIPHNPKKDKLVSTVTNVVRINPPLATCIGQKKTEAILHKLGFVWPDLTPEDYWTNFARLARNGNFKGKKVWS